MTEDQLAKVKYCQKNWSKLQKWEKEFITVLVNDYKSRPIQNRQALSLENIYYQLTTGHRFRDRYGKKSVFIERNR